MCAICRWTADSRSLSSPTFVQYTIFVTARLTVVVYRNDQITVEDCLKLNPARVVVSPGPGNPSTAGISKKVIEAFAGKVPIFGVCLGHQSIFELYGGTITRAPTMMHGKVSAIYHDNKGIFEGMPQGFEATRYHSLVGDPETLPECLEVSARTADGMYFSGFISIDDILLNNSNLVIVQGYIYFQAGFRLIPIY